MCGIIGVIGTDPVNQTLYEGLTSLQHRGQDAAGIVTSDGKRLHLCRDNGYVRDVFTAGNMQRLIGKMGVGHLRYPTAGTSSVAEVQPFYVNSPFGITLGHNGNLINAKLLKRELFKQDRRDINTESDSEVLLNVFAQELSKSSGQKLKHNDVFNAIKGVHQRCQGAYAVIGMITREGLFGFRDPHGIRPLIYGSRETDAGLEYMLASESVALTTQGFKVERDIKPGEAIFISKKGKVKTKQCAKKRGYSTCIFEYVYFARPDSVIDDVFVHKAQMRMGIKLAEKILRLSPKHNIDVVIPIPDSSRTSALELAHILGVRYREGFIKNRYIGRTFIMPGQKQRKKSVRRKLNALDIEFKGKNVLLVDDSIVRGTTSKEIVQMVRDAGAKKVYFASASPKIKYPNVYGINMPAAKELIAHQRSTKQIAKKIGVDWLIYQDLRDLIEAVREGNPELKKFDCSVFTGKYITGLPEGYLGYLERKRNDAKKNKKQPVHSPIDISHHS